MLHTVKRLILRTSGKCEHRLNHPSVAGSLIKEPIALVTGQFPDKSLNLFF
jgi:hypothetical protein